MCKLFKFYLHLYKIQQKKYVHYIPTYNLGTSTHAPYAYNWSVYLIEKKKLKIITQKKVVNIMCNLRKKLFTNQCEKLAILMSVNKRCGWILFKKKKQLMIQFYFWIFNLFKWWRNELHIHTYIVTRRIVTIERIIL